MKRSRQELSIDVVIQRLPLTHTKKKVFIIQNHTKKKVLLYKQNRLLE